MTNAALVQILDALWPPGLPPRMAVFAILDGARDERIYDAVHAFPAILVGIGVVAILGPSTIDVAYAVAIASTPTFARVTRSLVLVQKQKDYVLAAKACLAD